MRALITLSILCLATSTALADDKLSDDKLSVSASADVRGEAVSGFPVDRYGTEAADDLGLSPQLRLGAGYSRPVMSVGLSAEYEHDLATNADDELATNLRKAYLRARVGPLAIDAGWRPSHWGLGLLANDGAHGWTPGSARFASPRGGDVSLRGSVSAMLWPTQRLVAMVAVDRVHADDVMFDGDTATQAIAAVVFGHDQPRTAGIYAVRRAQETIDGGRVDVTVLDVTGRITLEKPWARLTIEGEVAAIVGTTTLASTNDFPTHDLRQLGAALRASLDAGDLGGVLDLVYASGDDNFDDAEQTAFKLDRNYDVGFLLFRHVMARQTQRATEVASDPDLIGMPPPDIERFASRGSATNVVAVFPRAWWRPLPRLEVYGGPLVAFSPEANADPFNSRIAGGSMRDALDGEAGHFLGTEIDVGVQYGLPTAFGKWRVGLEAGVLVPGAMDMDPVLGARTMLRYER